MDEFERLAQSMEGQKLTRAAVGREYITLYFERATLQLRRNLAAVVETATRASEASKHPSEIPTPNFDARMASTHTAEELLAKYKDMCGALMVAAEEFIDLAGRMQGASPSGLRDGSGKISMELLETQISGWLTQAQQRFMLAKPMPTERPQ